MSTQTKWAAMAATTAVAAVVLAVGTGARGEQTTRPRVAAPATTGVPNTAQMGLRLSPGAGPVIVVETAKGTIQFETYPNEAPKTVAHILALVRRNFYNGMRVHRVESGFIVQFGDPQSRDMSKQELWGTGGSGTPIGVAEFSRKRLHNTGAVATAHAGDARGADSQMYITLSPQHRLDGHYTVFGQVISGMDVVRTLQVNDIIRKMSVKP